MGRAQAYVGSAAFFLIAPGTVAGLVPWLATHWRVQPDTPVMSLIIGALMAAGGLAMVVESFTRFARTGGGTPAPVAPTQHLVVTGLYRFVRNPMYVGVLLLIFGQMLLFSSAALLAYGVAMWTAFHLFVVFFEEQRLERKFPEEYPAYAAAVPRWIPRLTPWKPEAGETSKKADADSAGL
jgi:protein-S-isoprenylcysteine O-methyltransferase Ste14